MKRKTLDKIFSAGGLVVAVLLGVLAYALWTQASFSTSYVKDQLGSQKIAFTAADKLTAEERSWQPGSACLIEYAGQPLQTGKQAECFANYYIALHMQTAANAAGFPGATYATLGTIRSDISAQITAAKAKNDATAAADLQKKLDSATALRTTMQTGESLRGMLLTTYGFSVLGDLAGLAAWILSMLAVVMFGLSVAGFGHAYLVPEDEFVLGIKPHRHTAPATA
jgi:hypothetical protein